LDDLSRIEKFLDEERESMILKADKALQDGAVNKFLAVAAERRMAERVKQEIDRIRREREA
jgi:hypothetical protein